MGRSDFAPKEILDLIATDKADPRKLERKPPSQELEFEQEQKELAIEAVEEFRFDGQEHLLEEKYRLVNFLSVKDLMLKLESTGKHFFLTDSNYPQMLGLWLGKAQNSEERKKYVCAIQQPWMPEWSVMRLDEHQLPQNWKYKGWRTILLQLIREHVIDEDQAHKVFGYPAIKLTSRMYRQHLSELRGGVLWKSKKTKLQ